MKGKRNWILLALCVILIMMLSVGCGDVQNSPGGQDENGNDGEKIISTPTLEDLKPIKITYLESFEELGDVSEGFRFWYDKMKQSTSPSFYLLDEKYAEEGMTAYLFCQVSEAEIPLKAEYHGTGTFYLDITTARRETSEEVEPREVLAVLQVDSRGTQNGLDVVNTYSMDSFLTLDTDDITVGWVDWSFLQNAPNGELSENDIAEVNRIFTPEIMFGNGACSNPNGLHCIIRSTFTSPEEISLGSFLRHFPFRDVMSEDEITSLENSDIWTMDRGVSDLPVPTKPYRAEDINRMLTYHLGITLDDLAEENKSDVMYFAEYDTYYNFVSDYGPGVFTCISGEKDGSRVYLYGESMCSNQVNDLMETINSCIVLEERDGRYLILSHTAQDATDN